MEKAYIILLVKYERNNFFIIKIEMNRKKNSSFI